MKLKSNSFNAFKTVLTLATSFCFIFFFLRLPMTTFPLVQNLFFNIIINLIISFWVFKSLEIVYEIYFLNTYDEYKSEEKIVLTLIFTIISMFLVYIQEKLLNYNLDNILIYIILNTSLLGSLMYLYSNYVKIHFKEISNKLSNYSVNIEQKKKNFNKGKKGEQTVKFEIDFITKNKKNSSYALHNKYFLENELSAQLDHVILNKKGLFLIETKNYSNNIKFTKDGKCHYQGRDKKWYESANISAQIKRHEIVIQNILHDTSFRNVPIYNILVFANNNIEIFETENVNYDVIKKDQLSDLILSDKFPDFFDSEDSEAQIQNLFELLTLYCKEYKYRLKKAISSIEKKSLILIGMSLFILVLSTAYSYSFVKDLTTKDKFNRSFYSEVLIKTGTFLSGQSTDINVSAEDFNITSTDDNRLSKLTISVDNQDSEIIIYDGPDRTFPKVVNKKYLPNTSINILSSGTIHINYPNLTKTLSLTNEQVYIELGNYANVVDPDTGESLNNCDFIYNLKNNSLELR